MAAHCESIEVNCYCPVVSHSGLVSFEFFSFGRGAGMGKEEVMLSFYCVWWMWIRPQSLQRSACILQQEKIGSPRITKMHTTLGYNAISKSSSYFSIFLFECIVGPWCSFNCPAWRYLHFKRRFHIFFEVWILVSFLFSSLCILASCVPKAACSPG